MSPMERDKREEEGEMKMSDLFTCQRSWRPWIWPKLNHPHLAGDDLKRDTADGPVCLLWGEVGSLNQHPEKHGNVCHGSIILIGSKLFGLLPHLNVLCQINENESKALTHFLNSKHFLPAIYFSLIKMYAAICKDPELCWFWWFWLWLSL